MAKARISFVCRSCGGVQSRWMGKCPDCGTWDSLEEHRQTSAGAKDRHRGVAEGVATLQSGEPSLAGLVDQAGAVARPIGEILETPSSAPRIPTGIGELDRVLGGGLVPGSVVLVGGDPGIGKSTLMLQAAAAMSQPSRGVPNAAVPVGGPSNSTRAGTIPAHKARRVLYVSSEESAEQIALRAHRLGVGAHGTSSTIALPQPEQSHSSGTKTIPERKRVGGPLPDDRGSFSENPTAPSPQPVSSNQATKDTARADSTPKVAGYPDQLFILAETNLARIVEQVRRVMPEILVIDSVQMVYKGDVEASPGSAGQLRRCAAELVYLAKLTGIVVVLVGHVTKDGQLAGPRLLEHLVDAVLYFEGDRYHAHRIIRGVKNRYGTTLEIGIFEMTGGGLREAPEGLGVSAITATSPGGKERVGSVVCPVMSGLRCIMVEVQALTATGFLGAAKRKSSGLDTSRLAMIIAVLEQHAGMRLADRDVFASAVGGIRVVEPAADLALLLAVAGANMRKSLPGTTAVVGEVGLGGEIRTVSSIEQRIREAARLGFQRIIAPVSIGDKNPLRVPGVEVQRVRTVAQAMEQLD